MIALTKLRLWLLPIAVAVGGALVIAVSAAILVGCLFLIYLVAVKLPGSNAGQLYSILTLTLMAIFGVWLIAWPLLRLGWRFCYGAYRTFLFIRLRLRDPKAADDQLRQVVAEAERKKAKRWAR